MDLLSEVAIDKIIDDSFNVDDPEAAFNAMKLRFLHGPEAGRSGMDKNEEIVKTVRDAVRDHGTHEKCEGITII
ncbi:hypothetical protein [Haloarcula marina]|uniref:hypothetical protein n=1 Tax=Haloarcula marina TaxID=2961574 RepID=UPI003D68CA80